VKPKKETKLPTNKRPKVQPRPRPYEGHNQNRAPLYGRPPIPCLRWSNENPHPESPPPVPSARPRPAALPTANPEPCTDHEWITNGEQWCRGCNALRKVVILPEVFAPRKNHEPLLRDILACFDDMSVKIFHSMEKDDFESLKERLRAALAIGGVDDGGEFSLNEIPP